MKTLFTVLGMLGLVRIGIGGVMCLFGYQWRKGLISITSLYVGATLGYILINLFDLHPDIGDEVLILIIVALIFMYLAYVNPRLNHFLIGFIVGNKLIFNLFFIMVEAGDLYMGIEEMVITTIFFSVIIGVLSCTVFKGNIIVICIAYIASVDVVINLSDLLNNTLFLTTNNFRYILDPTNIVCKLFGVELLSPSELLFIIIFTFASYRFQIKDLHKKGIDLSKHILDDRKLNK